MSYRRFCLSIVGMLVSTAFFFSPSTFSQERPHGSFGPLLKPLLKMTGFVNPTILPNEPRPVVTLALPGQQQLYKLLVTDTKLLPGPLVTPSSIFSEVKRYTISFYVRGPQDVVSQISTAEPTDQLIITAEYDSNGRFLFVQTVEKGEDPLQEKVHQQ